MFLAQLTDRHRKCFRDEDGYPVFYELQLGEIRAILGEAEHLLQRLHILAAGSESMLAECYQAFGLEPPKRIFEVLSDRDVPENTPKPAEAD